MMNMEACVLHVHRSSVFFCKLKKSCINLKFKSYLSLTIHISIFREEIVRKSLPYSGLKFWLQVTAHNV